MIPLKDRRIWQTRRRYAVSVLVCLCALSFAFGCKSGKLTESTPVPQQAQPTHVRPATQVSEADVYLDHAFLPLEVEDICCPKIERIRYVGSFTGTLTPVIDGKDNVVKYHNAVEFVNLVKPGNEPFIGEQNGKTIKLKSFPMIVDGFVARKGRWNFVSKKNSQNQYVVTLGNGCKLQIVYQDSRLSIGTETNLSHYGLRSTSCDLAKAREYLAEYTSGSKDAQRSTAAWIGYTPPVDVIPCLLDVDERNLKLKFVPLLEFNVERP